MSRQPVDPGSAVPPPEGRERLAELCAGAVLENLDEHELRELRDVDDQDAVARELAVFERVSASLAASLALHGVEPMSQGLRERLRVSALEFAAKAAGPRRSAPPRAAVPGSSATPLPVVARPRRAASLALPWLIAASAAAIALYVSWGRGASSAAPAHELREAFLAEHPESRRLPWAKGCEGEVLWSDRAQAGFLTIRGLPANDPRDFQYQLWIFDRAQDATTPVDGGVFDLASGAGSPEIVVPIDPKLRVHDAFAFAITKEKPGGVVVSAKRPEQIVAVVGL